MACWTVATAANRAARRWSSSMSSVVNEFHRHRASNDACFDSFVEKEADRLPPAIPVVESPVVHVHPDESVGLTAVETASEAHRMVQRVLPVVESVRNAFTQMPRDFLLEVARHVLPNDVSAEGKRKPGLLQPPRSHIGDQVQALVLVGELALVDQQTGVDVARVYGLFDLVERDDDGDEVGLVEPESEICASHHSGNSDALPGDVGASHGVLRHEHGAVAVTHGSSVREQRVSIGEIGIRVDRDRRHVELTAQGAAVQSLDVLQLVDIAQALGVDLSVGEGVEHERVVGVRAVGEMDGAWRSHDFIPRLFLACCKALVISSSCRTYSSSFLATSLFSAATSLRSY